MPNHIIMSFANKTIKYFLNLREPKHLPSGISIVNPYKSKEVRISVKEFYATHFDDNNERLFVFGINPGRFGGGLTGISFTDPVALRDRCGIENNLGNQKELSSKFIYETIEACGGIEKFYSKIYLAALYPFALIKNNKNYNYYDDKVLFETLKPEIVKSVSLQINFGAKREKVVILGKKNADYFKLINVEYAFFKQIIVLDHPRYIMQYRSKIINEYIEKYVNAFSF